MNMPMKKYPIIKKIMQLVCSVLVILPLSCQCLHRNTQSAESYQMTDSLQTATTDTIISDSMKKVKPIFINDSIQRIMAKANQVILYSFKSMVIPLSADESSKYDSIASFPVEKRIRNINLQERAILNFILSDETMYSEDKTPVKIPFYPAWSLLFKKGKENVYLLVSFSSETVAIATQNNVIASCRLNTVSPLLRWFDLVIPDNEYIQQIKKSKL